MSSVWDRLYVEKTKNFRKRSPYLIQQRRGSSRNSNQGLRRSGMNTVCPLKGASARPNTAYLRRIEKLKNSADIRLSGDSTQSTIVMRANRPSTAPVVVSHVSCFQGSVNQKISDQKGSFGTTRNIFGGLFA